MSQSRTISTLTPAMIVCWLVFASVPFWIERVGLYQYLGVEILIFATYALAYNLVLGHAGLPSFGHGAFFGVGAYAFGLAQFNIAANLWICLLAAAFAAALALAALSALGIDQNPVLVVNPMRLSVVAHNLSAAALIVPGPCCCPC